MPGKIIGHRVGGDPENEAEHFHKCPECGAIVDRRDLMQVIAHAGPLPHPKEDKPQ